MYTDKTYDRNAAEIGRLYAHLKGVLKMTKRNWAEKIAQIRCEIDKRLHTGAISPAQWHDEINALYVNMQKASGYSDGAFAQVWQAGCRQYERDAFGFCGKSTF